MSILESLKPTESPRVMDLVAEAGLDVAPWAISATGPVEHPASNPAHCYEWAFVGPDLVVLNLWHDELSETDGGVFDDVDPRRWATADGRPSAKKRADRFEEAMARAFEMRMPVRVIVGDGTRRAATERSEAEYRMKLRRLDPEPWHIEHYDATTGAGRIVRGAPFAYVDQYLTLGPESPPRRREATVAVWDRDRLVRNRALQRAKGRCEYCGVAGFKTKAGLTYLETHHIQPLSQSGVDDESNVAALCANHHREAHHGENRDEIRVFLQSGRTRTQVVG